MNTLSKISLITVVTAMTSLTALNASANWKGDRGNCQRADMQGGPSMQMKQKRHKARFQNQELNLTADQAQTLVKARLIRQGNDRLKVGQVTEKDDTTYVVDIVTVDDSLVRQIEVDRNTGLPRGPMRR